MTGNPKSRYIFDEAAGHVYQLMKNDSYPRYLRSDQYKEYLNGTKKKVRIKIRDFMFHVLVGFRPSVVVLID